MFVYRPGVHGNEQVTIFALVAQPIAPGTTGKRFFYLDEGGVIREADSQIIGPNSAPLGESVAPADDPDDDEQDNPAQPNKP